MNESYNLAASSQPLERMFSGGAVPNNCKSSGLPFQGALILLIEVSGKHCYDST